MPRRPLIAGVIVALVALGLGWVLLREEPEVRAPSDPAGLGRETWDGPHVKDSTEPRTLPAPPTTGSAGTATTTADRSAPPQQGPPLDPALLPPARRPLAGRVIDGDGRPIPGAQVLAGGLRGEELGPTIAVADDAGRFGLDELPPTGLLEVVAERFARRVVAVDASTERLEVVLVAARALEGRVVAAEDERPLAGALVEGESASWRNRARTGEDGRFRFDDVPDEQAMLVVACEGRRGRAVEERDAALVRLERGRAVRGLLVDEAARPVPGALVFVVGAEQLAHPHSTRADAAGRFELTGVGPEEAFAVLAFGARGGVELATPLELSWVEAEGDVTVTLGPLRTVLVRGAPAAPLALVPASCPPGVPAAAPRAGQPGPGGLRFEGVVPGAWQLEAHGRSVGELIDVPAGDPAQPHVVDWAGPAAEPVVARRTGTLRVRVVDELRRPVAGATVVVSGPGDDVNRQTGPDGLAAFDDPPGGVLTISASSPGRVLVAPGLWEEAGPGEVELALARPVTLEGRVQLPAGARGAAFLTLSAPDGTLLRTAQPGPDGRFRLADLPPGRHVLEAAADGCAPLELQLELPLSGELLVPLQPGGEDDHEHPEGEHAEEGRG